jgi:hypothetical protein
MSDQVKRKIIPCPECSGRGFVMAPIIDTKMSIWGAKNIACDTCNGYGYTLESPQLSTEVA